jgi:16S rRNA (guanine966-N2)-methyltransferase
VRETLFNWLAPEIQGSHCLDLFAGSGALGLEALSRGAADCVFVDSHAAAIRGLQTHLDTLGCERAQLHCSDAIDWIQAGPGGIAPFDIVFLDPPFEQGLLTPACQALESGNWLTPGAAIYLESGARETDAEVPGSWRLHREKKAGEVRYRLFVRPD